MLAADQRLRRADDFATVMRSGRRAARNGLVVHLRVADHAPDAPARPRAGFVIPKAVGSAVARNKIRRRLRHLLRTDLDRLDSGTDVVVRVLPEAAGRSFGELARHLREALAAAQRASQRGTSEQRSVAERAELAKRASGSAGRSRPAGGRRAGV